MPACKAMTREKGLREVLAAVMQAAHCRHGSHDSSPVGHEACSRGHKRECSQNRGGAPFSAAPADLHIGSRGTMHLQLGCWHAATRRKTVQRF